MSELALMAVVVALSYVYAFVGGFTDAANAIATSVGSRVLTFRAAVVMAGTFNLIGGLTGTAVAATVGKGIIDPEAVTLATVAAGLSGAMCWSLLTYFHGIPVSETHGLVGGLVGSGVATAGFDIVNWAGVLKVAAAIVVSPLAGLLGGYLLMMFIQLTFSDARRATATPVFVHLQRFSAALMAFSHGRNDAQKPMGVLALALTVYFGYEELRIPTWVIVSCSSVAALGTSFGGWRIIKTLGMKLTRLRPPEGFAAEVSGAGVIQLASNLGIPVSTTHAISSSIAGVGLARRKGGVRWRLAQDIMASWVLTIPVTFLLGFLFARLLALLSH